MIKTIKGLIMRGLMPLKLNLLEDEWLKNLKHNTKIINATLMLKLNKNVTCTYKLKCGEKYNESIVFYNNNVAYVNVTELLYDAISGNKDDMYYTLGEQSDFVDLDTYKSALTIEYETETLSQENRATIERNLGASGSLDINLSSGKLRYAREGISANSLGGNIDISQIYTCADLSRQGLLVGSDMFKLPKSYCGNNFKLNLQQYVVKTKSIDDNAKDVFYLVDGAGILHEFIDRYYYNSPITGSADKTEKIYVEKQDVNVSLDGKLTYSLHGIKYDVQLEQITESGLKLAAKMEDFKGVKYLEQRQEDIARLEEENKQYNKNLEGAYRNLEDIEDNKTKLIESFEQVHGILDNYGKEGYYKFELARQLKYFDIDPETENYSAGIAKYNKFTKQCDSGEITTTSRKSSVYYDYINLVENKKLVEESIKEIEEKLDKNNVNLQNYKKTDPQVYATDSDGMMLAFCAVSGFPNIFALTHMVDSYENTTVISYDNGKIISVTDQEKELFKLTYNNDGLLCKIESNDGKKEQFKYIGDSLIEHIDQDARKTFYTYLANKLTSIASEDGNMIELLYQGDKVVGLVDKVTHDTINADTKPLAYQYTKFAAKSDIVYTSPYSASVTDSQYDMQGNFWQSKTTVYQYDAKGRTTTVYEIKNSEEQIKDIICFDYADDRASFSVKPLQTDSLIDINSSVKLSSALNATIWSKEISSSVLSSRDYVFSAFATADSAYVCKERNTLYSKPSAQPNCSDNCNKERTFELRAELTYTDNTTDLQRCSFDWKNTAKQFLAFPVCVQDGKAISKIKLIAEYANNTGECVLEHLQFKEAEWEYREFNKDKLVTYSENSVADVKELYEYDENKRLVKNIKTYMGKSYPTSYEYNLQGKLIKTIDYNGMCSQTMFNNKGKEIKTMSYNINAPAMRYIIETKYDEQGKEIAQVDGCGQYNSAENVYHGIEQLGVKDAKGNNNVSASCSASGVSQIASDTDGILSEVSVKHNLGYMVTCSYNGRHYDYTYDGMGRTLAIDISGKRYVSTQYDLLNKFVQSVNANGETFITANDEKDRVKSVDYIDQYGKRQNLTTNAYDKYGNLTQVIDNLAQTGYTVNSTYDKRGTITGVSDGTVEISASQDDLGRISAKIISSKHKPLAKYKYRYADGIDGKLDEIQINGKAQSAQYDALGRTKSIDNHNSYVREFSYIQRGEYATQLIGKIDCSMQGKTCGHTRYTYDKLGNIERVLQNGIEVVKYHYDSLSRLIREDNRLLDSSVTFEYDQCGNIVQKSVYAYTNIENIDTEQPTKVIPYAYNSNGWRDQLASYNGKGMVYDLLGNPNVYRNTKLTWKYGRQLMQYGDISSYTYLSDGTRRTKTVEGKTTTYTRLDGKLIGETDGKNTIVYLYGIDGIYGFECNGATYMYGKDLQGNVTQIMDMSGNVLAKYVYDAFGNHKAYAIVDGAEQQVYDSMTGESAKVKIPYNSASISNGKLSMVLGYTGSAVINAKIPLVIGCQSNATGNEFLEHDSIALINPIRYRGYYYDQETGLYYLQSRYYDSEVGRFINADDISYLDPETLGGLNLYAYCGNNPVMMTDSYGTLPEVNGTIEIWTLFSRQGNLWYSGRYQPKGTFNAENFFKHLRKNLLYLGELTLYALDLRAVTWKAEFLSITDQSFTFSSFGVDLLDGRFNFNNQTDYLGLKIGSAKFDLLALSLESGNLKINILDVEATALTVGLYSQYVDAEVLIGSISATAKWDNGALTLGLSWGWGIKITIRFW